MQCISARTARNLTSMPTVSSSRLPTDPARDTPLSRPTTLLATTAHSSSPWRIVGIYTVVASLWIFGSDHLLALLFEHSADLLKWSVYKGIAFVVFTATLLLFLVRRAVHLIELEQANTLIKERALRASEAQLAEIVNTATDAIVALDEVLRIVLCNSAAEEIFGCDRGRMIGAPISDFIPDLAAADIGGGHLLQVRRPDGTVIPVEGSIAQTQGDLGTALTLILRDIRDRIDRERCLSQERAKLIEAQEVANLGSWDIEFASGAMTWSLQAYEIFAVDPTEFAPSRETVLGRVHPDDRELVLSALARLPTQAPAATLEHRLLLPDGRIRHVEQRWQVFRDERGQPLRASGTCHDISARRQAEDARREQALLLANAERMGRMGSWSLDIASDRLLWSDATCALFGISPAEFTGTSAQFHALVVAEDLALLQGLSAVVSPEQVAEIHYRIHHPDGSIHWMYERGVVEFDAAGRPVRQLGMVMDVTERHEARIALQKSVQALNARNQELEEFAYVASHDLQEPLRKIRTFSEILTTRCQASLDGAARDYLDRVNRAAIRMQALIDGLLEYSRVATVSRTSTPVDLALICREVLSDLEARIEATQARIQVPELPTITANAVQMRQLFQNLLGNALKFHSAERTPEVVMTCEPAQLGGSPAVRIEIADNGIGFEAKFAEKIFNPFQRLHSRSEYEGTGMGLAIVRRVVERHGGTVCASGTPSVGARFTVVLPTVAVAAEPAAH